MHSSSYLIQIIFFKRKTGSHFMTTKAQKKIRNLLKLLFYVIVFDRIWYSARSFQNIIVFCNNDSRNIILFRKFSGNNTDDTQINVRDIQNQWTISKHTLFFYNMFGFLQYYGRLFFANSICGYQFICQFFSFIGISRRKQPECQICIIKYS